MAPALATSLRRASLAACLVTAACTGGAGDRAAADSTLLLGPTPSADLIRAGDGERDLAARLGEAAVRRDSVYTGEGIWLPGTVFYPGDPARRLEVVWRDSLEREEAEVIFVRDSLSSWTLHPGVGMGTTLRRLEELNGRPFPVSGFGWDYGGTITSYAGGRLDSIWRAADGGLTVLIRLAPSVSDPAREQEVLGETLYPSDHPALRAIEPRVWQMLLRPRPGR